MIHGRMTPTSSPSWGSFLLLLLIGAGLTKNPFSLAKKAAIQNKPQLQLQLRQRLQHLQLQLQTPPPLPPPFVGSRSIQNPAIFHNSLKSIHKDIHPINHTQRSLQSDDSCQQYPFLWTIRRKTGEGLGSANPNNRILGYAIGTMHLDPAIVMTKEAWTSIRNVVDDACAVYGELDLTRLSVATQAAQCLQNIEIGDDMVTIDQLPDEELRDAYQAKLLEFVEASIEGSGMQKALVVKYLMAEVSILQILDTLSAFNTQNLPQDTTSLGSFMDQEILELGRPSGAMETVETQCKVFEKLWKLNVTDFWNHYEDYWKFELEKGLEDSQDGLIDAYRCGDAEKVQEILSENYMTSVHRKESYEFMFDKRNIQMANFIANILDEQVLGIATKTVFAVGLGHWLPNLNDEDSNDMIQLLDDRGYVLERVEGLYDPEFLPDASDKTCGLWDPLLDEELLQCLSDTVSGQWIVDNDLKLAEAFDAYFDPSMATETMDPTTSTITISLDKALQEEYRNACINSGGSYQDDPALSLDCPLNELVVRTNFINYGICVANNEGCRGLEFWKFALHFWAESGVECRLPVGYESVTETEEPALVANDGVQQEANELEETLEENIIEDDSSVLSGACHNPSFITTVFVLLFSTVILL